MAASASFEYEQSVVYVSRGKSGTKKVEPLSSSALVCPQESRPFKTIDFGMEHESRHPVTVKTTEMKMQADQSLRRLAAARSVPYDGCPRKGCRMHPRWP